MQDAIAKYLAFLEQTKGRTKLTKEHYRAYLERIARIVSIEKISDITPSSIKKINSYLKSDGLSSNTINYYLIALRNFIKYLPKSRQPIDPKSIKLSKIKKNSETKLNSIDVQQLLIIPRRSSKRLPIIRARDDAILSLLYEVKIKLIELTSLKLKDLLQKTKTLSTKSYKGKSTIHNLPPSVLKKLKRYVSMRTDNSQYLFVAHDRAHNTRLNPLPLSMRSIQRLVKYASKKAGRNITIRGIQHAK